MPTWGRLATLPKPQPDFEEVRLMKDAFVVSTARTPIGKGYRGAFNNTEGPTMAAHAIGHAVARAQISPDEVEDVVHNSRFLALCSN